MTTRTLSHAASLGALIAFMALTPILPAPAADGPQKVVAVKVAASEGTSRSIPLGIGKSVAIDLPADIKDVLVADPKIANAVVRTARRAYIIGVKVGQFVRIGETIGRIGSTGRSTGQSTSARRTSTARCPPRRASG